MWLKVTDQLGLDAEVFGTFGGMHQSNLIGRVPKSFTNPSTTMIKEMDPRGFELQA
jgi:hypothetical protein